MARKKQKKAHQTLQTTRDIQRERDRLLSTSSQLGSFQSESGQTKRLLRSSIRPCDHSQATRPADCSTEIKVPQEAFRRRRRYKTSQSQLTITEALSTSDLTKDHLPIPRPLRNNAKSESRHITLDISLGFLGYREHTESRRTMITFERLSNAQSFNHFISKQINSSLWLLGLKSRYVQLVGFEVVFPYSYQSLSGHSAHAGQLAIVQPNDLFAMWVNHFLNGPIGQAFRTVARFTRSDGTTFQPGFYISDDPPKDVKVKQQSAVDTTGRYREQTSYNSSDEAMSDCSNQEIVVKTRKKKKNKSVIDSTKLAPPTTAEKRIRKNQKKALCLNIRTLEKMMAKQDLSDGHEYNLRQNTQTPLEAMQNLSLTPDRGSNQQG